MVVRPRAALVLLVLLVAGCTAGGEAVAPPAPAQTSAPPPPSTPAPSLPTEGDAVALPVYYVVRTAAGPRLYRELHHVSSDHPPSAAVREMLARPTGSDPDYRNPWPAGAALRSPVEHDGKVITVDLTGLDGGQPGSDLDDLAVQQLVFTVQDVLHSTDPVRILVDGERVDRLWGVNTKEPVERGDPYELRSLVQIDSPAYGASVGRTVRVTGEAAVFEANLHWEVVRGDTVVRSGSAATEEGQRFAPYAFEVVLDPGEYVVRVMEDDVSGGEGRPVLVDDKMIVVS
jgi:hypothetical protein